MRLAALLSLLLPLVQAQVGTSSHVQYAFKDVNAPGSEGPFTEISMDFTWLAMTSTNNVYFALQWWFECGQGGYYGVQMHSDGSHLYNYAIWDLDATHITSFGVDPQCSRFGGEGTGSHCQVAPSPKFVFGRPYTLTISPDARNATGDTWACTATDTVTGQVTRVGRLFLANSAGKYGNLKQVTVSFQEYYTGGNFYSALAMAGPRAAFNPVEAAPSDKLGVGVPPAAHGAYPDKAEFNVPKRAVAGSFTAVSAVTSSDDAHHGISAKIPGGPSGRPYTFYEAGLNVTTTPTNTKLW